MSVALLVVGICGVVLASLPLGWQAANYVLTGGRVKVRLRVGGLGNGGLVTAPRIASGRTGGKPCLTRVPAADRRSDGGQRGPPARYGGQVRAEVRVGNVALPGGRLDRAAPGQAARTSSPGSTRNASEAPPLPPRDIADVDAPALRSPEGANQNCTFCAPRLSYSYCFGGHSNSAIWSFAGCR